MSNRIPGYLRLHTEDIVETSVSTPTEFDRICSAMANTTGFAMRVTPRDLSAQLEFPWSESRATTYSVNLTPTADVTRNTRLNQTRELEESLANLLNALAQTRHSLRMREAELATMAPIVPCNDDGAHLVERLDAVLRVTSDMLHCTGAGLYLLDESTTSLKLRAHSGLSPDALLKPARPLEETVADVEALAGQAVVIESVALQSHWNVPEVCESAICVPVSSATTILGTLWLFRDRSQDFTPTEQNLVEIAAGRLASDLERACLEQEVKTLRGSLRINHEIDELSESRRTKVAPTVESWDVAESTTGGSVHDFCNWRLSDEDRLLLGVGAAHGGTSRHLSAVSFQATHASHSQHESSIQHTMRCINESLWASSSEGQSASLFHAVLDPECGALQYAIHGGVFAYVLRPHGWEPLLASNGALGNDDTIEPDVHRQVLMPGDILFAMSSPGQDRSFEIENRINQIAEKLLHNTHLPADELAEMAAWSAEDWRPHDANSLSVLVMKRQDAKPS